MPIAASALFLCSAALAKSPAPPLQTPKSCIAYAEDLHGTTRPVILLGILHHETGRIGRVTRNSNGTVDIGPFQINSSWLPKFARYWNITQPAAYQTIRDSWCANASAAAIILGLAIDDAHGDLWRGVGRYHSPTPRLAAAYARKVARTVRDYYARTELVQAEQPGASQEGRAMLR